MNRRRITLAVLLVTAFAASPVLAAGDWSLSSADWARPRDGATIAAMPPLPAVVEAWSRRASATLVVRYPGGEAGDLWAAELADWLVALGVPGSAIATVPGGRPGRLAFEITRGDVQ